MDKAAARHAARTPEQIDDIKKRAEERQKRIAGDSLSERFQPTLVSDPKSCSFDNLYNTPDNDAIQTHDLAKFKRDHISSYLELQYHGDLTIDCVESLTFPYDLKDPSRSQFLKVAEKWKAAGAKIYYIVSDTLYQL